MLQDENSDANYVNARPLTTGEIDNLFKQITGWAVVEVNNVPRLQKEYRFKNFIESLNFTITIGQLAEQQGHHPAILTEWGKVTVYWWTHKVHGLHRNDFIMAAKTDALNLT